MNYKNWYVGMRVVYDPVDEEIPGISLDIENENELEVGEVYTISWIGDNNSNEIFIDLLQYPLPECSRYCRGRWAGDFKPVACRKSDISIFTEMLNKNYSKETQNV